MTGAIRPEYPVKDRLLTPEQRTLWEENRWIINPNTMPQENLDEVIDASWKFLKVDCSDPDTWYQVLASRAGTFATGLTEYAVCIR